MKRLALWGVAGLAGWLSLGCDEPLKSVQLYSALTGCPVQYVSPSTGTLSVTAGGPPAASVRVAWNVTNPMRQGSSLRFFHA